MDDYVYYNATPDYLTEYDGEDINDCVIRAISTALNIDYKYVDKLLQFVSKEFNCPKLCVCCYVHLLEDIFQFKTYRLGKYATVRDLCKKFKDKKVIVRCPNHLTFIYRGKSIDKFNCMDYKVTHFWIVG